MYFFLTFNCNNLFKLQQCVLRFSFKVLLLFIYYDGIVHMPHLFKKLYVVIMFNGLFPKL